MASARPNQSLRGRPGGDRSPGGWFMAGLLALGAARMAYVGGSWVRNGHPADLVRILVFAGVALIMSLAPGLFLRRWLRIRTSNPCLDALYVVVASLCASALLVWISYAAGVYVCWMLILGLALLAALGVHGLAGIVWPWARVPARLSEFGRLSFGEGLSLVFSLLMAQGVFEQVVGTPMVSWDALVSWDKWAADAGVRTGLARYALGGYPQFLPCLGSIFYKLAGSGSTVFPVEHLLLTGFYVVFLAILVLGVLALGRTLGFPGGVVLCLFLGNRLVFEMATQQMGSVDIPCAALLASACAVCAAHVQGSWTTEGKPWRTAVALFFPFFALAFIKGNGLAWLVILAGALAMALRSKSRFRPAGTAVAVALALSLAYWGHQAWFGALHWELSEQSPFLRSHTFVAAHTREFALSWGHFRHWCAQLGSSYGISGPLGGAGILVLALLACLAGLMRRKWRFFALAGPVAMGVWFFTGSYDFRNAAAAWLVVLVAGTGWAWDAGQDESRRARRWVVRGLLAAAVAWCGFQLERLSAMPLPVGKESTFMGRRTGGRSLWRVPLGPYAVPRIAALPENRRHMGVRPWGDIREILFQAPFGRRAAHLLAADGLYRVLAPKGVYMMHKTRYNDQQRHDVALGEPYLKPPPDYEKAARFRRVHPYNVPVRLFRPEFQPVAMRAAGSAGEDLRTTALRAGESVSIEFSPPEADRLDLKEGILALRLVPPAAEASLRLSGEDARRDPYSAYFESVREGDEVRLLYWMADNESALPRFVLTAGTGDVGIAEIRWGR